VEYLGVILLEFCCNFEGVTSCQDVLRHVLTLEVLALITTVPGRQVMLIRVIFFYGYTCGQNCLTTSIVGESFPANVCVCSSHGTAIDVTCCQSGV